MCIRDRYTDTPDETYNELTLKFKNELTAEGTKAVSYTHLCAAANNAQPHHFL